MAMEVCLDLYISNPPLYMNHYSEQFEKYTMAGLKFWSCLFLLLVSFSSSETRSPAAFSDNGANQALIEGGKELFKARNERKVERPFESWRT